MVTVEHVLSINNLLGEGPIWHPGEQALYWVDIDGHQFYRLIPTIGELQTFDTDQQIGCLALHESGGLIIAKRDGIFHWQANAMTLLISSEKMGAANRFNDGAVDRAGRFWVGTTSSQPENPLYCIDVDGSFRVAEKGIGISNGIGWSPDNTIMYYSDSGGAGIVYAYDFDLASGSLSNRRTFLPPTGTSAVADGLTVDSEGCIWIAFWNGWRVERRAPDGSLLAKIDLPVQRPTSCIFGGPDLTDLYVTSAGVDCDRTEQPQAGDVFRLRTGVTGLPEPVCKVVT
jgi:sugar lactone lactonase YvrE